jgi:PAT family beta-lactamase induction signal transducer AmpG
LNQAVAEPRGWRRALAAYRDPAVVGMLFLGFSAGLPFPLVFATLSRWLSEADVSLHTIGLFSFAGLAWGFKFVWAPLVDRMPLPVAGALLGRRRAWMLLAQLAIAGGLAGMAFTDPRADLWTMALCATIVAFASATQDIAIDAWRIEIAPQETQGALAGAYQLGYRVALFAAGAGVFLLVDAVDDANGWTIGYLAMVALMAVGVVTTFCVREPKSRTDAATEAREARLAAKVGRGGVGRVLAWFGNAVVNPFVDFFARNGWSALLILAFIGCYWMSDRVWAVMAQPFYFQLGFTKTEIALVSKSYGIALSIAGALLGGAVIARFGVGRPLVLCTILMAATNLMFAFLALHGRDMTLLVLVISGENLTSGLAGTALIAYLSGLTNVNYTATQYALFSSFMALPGKLLAGVSGWIVEAIGFPLFFVYTAAMGVPAITLALILLGRERRAAAPR